MLRRLLVLAGLSLASVAVAATAAGGVPAQDSLEGERPRLGSASGSERGQADRFATSRRVGSGCGRRVVEGDIPYASFRDRAGDRPRVRVCVRDRDGRYCLPRRRPPRNGVLLEPVLYKNTGPQLTTWRIRGKVVGRWRWQVPPEPE